MLLCEYLYINLSTSNNQRLCSAGDINQRSKHFRFISVLWLIFMGDFLTHERSFKHASDQIVFFAFYSFLVEVHTKLAEQPRDYDCGLLLLPAISQW